MGLTHVEAIKAHGAGAVQTLVRPMSSVDRALCMGEDERGFIKLVYRRDGTILGATVVGPSAGELISEISLAISAKVELSRLASVMHAYPTISIALQQMAAEVKYAELERLMPLYNVLKRMGV